MLSRSLPPCARQKSPASFAAPAVSSSVRILSSSVSFSAAPKSSRSSRYAPSFQGAFPLFFRIRMPSRISVSVSPAANPIHAPVIPAIRLRMKAHTDGISIPSVREIPSLSRILPLAW